MQTELTVRKDWKWGPDPMGKIKTARSANKVPLPKTKDETDNCDEEKKDGRIMKGQFDNNRSEITSKRAGSIP